MIDVTHTRRRLARAAVVLSLGLAAAGIVTAFGGCQAAYFAFGQGDAKALYTLPPGRTLVFVDPRPGAGMTQFQADTLAKQVNDHLWHYKAVKETDTIIPEYRIAELAKSGDKFRGMSIADVAKTLNADTVIYVSVPVFKIGELADAEVSTGKAQGFVKVLDKNGKHLWPEDESEGAPVSAAVNYSDKNDTKLAQELMDKLTVRIGSIFHAYALEDKTFRQSPE